MRIVPRLVAIGTAALLLDASPASALDPSLQISQYAHTAWTIRDGFSLGPVFSMAQTPDGYLWLASGFGVFRFDGIRFTRWQPPAPGRPIRGGYALLSARDGTLWIGMLEGLVSWRNGRLTTFPEFDHAFVTSMLEDRDGTVWIGTIDRDVGRLCTIRGGRATCSHGDRRFGALVWSLLQDASGTLWVGADSGLWRWTADAPQRYPIPGRIGDLSTLDGRLVVGIRHKALWQLVGETVEPYPLVSDNGTTVLKDREVDGNKLLRDRDGGLWMGTADGLIHVHRGRADTFTKADGLSGNTICGLFEDREGSIWVATTGGLDRFRELAVRTYSTRQGLPTDDIQSLVAAKDGGVWLATLEGLLEWRDGRVMRYRTSSGLPDDRTQSLFEDSRGRLWVFTKRGLAYYEGRTFVAVPGVPSQDVFSIAGDEVDNLWLSGNSGLTHLRSGRVVEHFPWSALGRRQQAKMVLAHDGGVWLSFWNEGGVEYFRDGRVRASYSAANGLGKGHVPGLALDQDGAIWASTEEGGLSRIKDGRVTTLTTSNGLPCDAIHQATFDESRSLWGYGGCGFFRITRPELQAWVAEPTRRVQVTLWDAAEGANLWPLAPSAFGPFLTRSRDGRLWALRSEGIQVIDPRHLPSNEVLPPVHIERLIADHTIRWQQAPGVAVASALRLPPRVRDVEIDFTALSLAAPEKVHFKYRLDDQDHDWREVVNERHVQYSNLRPGTYRFRVIASNNTGLWNEQGDTLHFSIDPAYYQTVWFRALCVAGAAGLLWAGYLVRVRQLRHQFEVALNARVSERTRIARDLHDTLLQSFHGLLLRFQTASHLLPDQPVDAKERLDHAIGQAASAIAEARDAIQGLRDSTMEGSDLAAAISTLADELTAGPGEHPAPAFRVIVEGEPRPLHPILRDEIYKITSEALRNAFRHAAATRVEVEVRYDHERLRLRVQDDGRGFDAASISNRGRLGHYGLSGMRERAAVMGGTLTVWSKEGAGSAVELSIPSATAYVKARKPRA